MKELYQQFDKLSLQAKANREAAYQLIVQKKEKIKRLEKQIEKLDERTYNYPSWIEVILKPLSDRLSEKLGLPYEIYGPFGLSCETSVYFVKDTKKRVSEQEAKGITVYPEFAEDGSLYLKYYTGKKTDDYEPWSIGDLNGFNKVKAPLPESIEEILAIIEKKGEI